MTPDELREKLAHDTAGLSERYTGRPLREDLVEAELRAYLAAQGWIVDEVRWRDGDYGRIADVRVRPPLERCRVELTI